MELRKIIDKLNDISVNWGYSCECQPDEVVDVYCECIRDVQILIDTLESELACQ